MQNYKSSLDYINQIKLILLFQNPLTVNINFFKKNKTTKMKVTLICVLALFGFIRNSNAQSSIDYPKPEFDNQIYYLDGSNKLHKLEKQSGAVEVSYPFIYLCIKEIHSDIRLPNNEDLRFVIRTTHPVTDINMMYQLFTTFKKRRSRFSLVQYVDKRGTMTNKNDKISFSYKKISEDTYLISPDKKLEEGEYVFASSAERGSESGVESYCFGIGEIKK